MIDADIAMGLFAAGAAVGAAYLGLLWASIRLLAQRKSLIAYLLLAALRGVLIIGALWLAAMLEVGAGGILVGLAGFVALRLAVVFAADHNSRKDA